MIKEIELTPDQVVIALKNNLICPACNGQMAFRKAKYNLKISTRDFDGKPTGVIRLTDGTWAQCTNHRCEIFYYYGETGDFKGAYSSAQISRYF